MDHWLGWMLYGIAICTTFLVIKVVNFRLHKALDMNPEEDEEEEEGGEKTGEEEEEEKEAEEEEKVGFEDEEGERKELGLDGKLVEPHIPGERREDEEEEEEEEREESLNNHRDSASTLGQSSTYHSSQETAELQLVSSGARAEEEEEEGKEEGAAAIESLLGMIEAEVEVRRGKEGGDSRPGSGCAKPEEGALVIQIDASSSTDPVAKQSSDDVEITDEKT